MAVSAMAQTDPQEALPVLTKILAAPSSSRKVKERSLFVLAQMGTEEASSAIAEVARGNSSPELQRKAIQYLGVFGGPAPDAFVALIRLLNALWDERGNTAVAGLTAFEWPGAEYPEELYREMSGMLPGVEVVGDGSIASKLWSQPTVSVTLKVA